VSRADEIKTIQVTRRELCYIHKGLNLLLAMKSMKSKQMTGGEMVSRIQRLSKFVRKVIDSHD